MFDTILNLFAPWLLVALAVVAGWFGVKSKLNERKAAKATEQSMIYRRQAESMDAKEQAQERAQEAARGVPKPKLPDPKKRTGLGSRW